MYDSDGYIERVVYNNKKEDTLSSSSTEESESKCEECANVIDDCTCTVIESSCSSSEEEEEEEVKKIKKKTTATAKAREPKKGRVTEKKKEPATKTVAIAANTTKTNTTKGVIPHIRSDPAPPLHKESISFKRCDVSTRKKASEKKYKPRYRDLRKDYAQLKAKNASLQEENSALRSKLGVLGKEERTEATTPEKKNPAKATTKRKHETSEEGNNDEGVESAVDSEVLPDTNNNTPIETKQCKTCKCEKPITTFQCKSTKKKADDNTVVYVGTRTICSSCRTQANRRNKKQKTTTAASASTEDK